ncbi:MAG: alpha/beta fold hydrolase [Burkholderiaceae bacterium]|nr:MAG: alpha/beta fold hydrolase [Burkholderiaceae bacterium]
MTALPVFHAHAHNADRLLHATFGKLTHGLSPASLGLAYIDWALHLCGSPGKQADLVEIARLQWSRFANLTLQAYPSGEPCIEPLPQDKRFADPAWQQWPFNLAYQGFLLTQQWWHCATRGVRGVSPHHEEVVTFCTRQWLDTFAPSNFLWSNPEVLQATVAEGGTNLLRGWQNFIADSNRIAMRERPKVPEQFQVGKGVALTPGQVVFRNRLIELIQYAPATEQVHAEPVLIVPSWIMKYYILDLSPHNSLVRYLVGKGHTVFMVSWVNPGEHDRDLGLNGYLRQGLLSGFDAVSQIIPEQPIHAVGYCLGGTLLLIASALLARRNDTRLKSLTLLAAQADFEESGELSLFTDPSQIAYLEDIMWDQGYLDGRQMGGTFALLRSRDLVWSRMVHDYLRGTRQPMIDLLAWNEDSTRLPYRMHSEYLRHLYMDNTLAHGAYLVDDKPVVLSDSHVPMFVVGTVKDHVSPWHSVYKIHLLSSAEVTFVLTSGGHNVGIVSEPGHPHRSYQITTRKPRDKYIDPLTWQQTAPSHEGSWWPAWQQWLSERSGPLVTPPTLGRSEAGFPPLQAAPGSYVLQQ